MSRLLDVALDSFDFERVILVRIDGGEAQPGSVVAYFDVR